MFPESRSAIYFTHFWAFVPFAAYSCTLAPFEVEAPETSRTLFSASADWNVYEPSEFLMAIPLLGICAVRGILLRVGTVGSARTINVQSFV